MWVPVTPDRGGLHAIRLDHTILGCAADAARGHNPRWRVRIEIGGNFVGVGCDDEVAGAVDKARFAVEGVERLGKRGALEGMCSGRAWRREYCVEELLCLTYNLGL